MAFGLDLGSIYAHVRANTVHFMAGMSAVETRVSATATKINIAGGRMVKTFGLVGAAVGALSLKAFASFDDAMTKSTAIMGDLEDETVESMRNIAVALSMDGVQSAKSLADSYFFLASAGLDAQQSMEALPVVQAFATAGAFDMAQATDLLTDAQSALGKTVDDSVQNMKNMTAISDVLVKANTLANASTEQFSKSLTSKAGPAMKVMNIAVEEGVAVLAAYADQGIKAEESGNMFSRMLRLMMKGFIDNRGAWEHFKVDIEDVDGSLRPMHDIIRQITAATKDMTPVARTAALQMLGFEARAQDAILPLLGLGDAIEEYEKDLRSASGITKEVAEKQLKSFGNQWRIVWNNIKAVGIVLGDVISKFLPPLARFFKAISEWVVDNQRVIQEWADWITAKVTSVTDVLDRASRKLVKALTPGAELKAINEGYEQIFNEMKRRGEVTGEAFRKTWEGIQGSFGGMREKLVPTNIELYRDIRNQVLGISDAAQEARKEHEALKDSIIKSKITIPELGLPGEGDLVTPSLEELAGQLQGLEDVQDGFRGLIKPIKTYEEAMNVMSTVYDGLDEKNASYFLHIRSRLEMNVETWSKNANEIASLIGAEEDAVRSLIAAYAEHQEQLINIQEAKAGGNLFKGFAAGVQEMQMNLQTIGELGADIANSFVDDMTSGITDVVNGTRSWEDALRDVGSQIADIMMQFAVRGALTAALGGATGSPLGGLFASVQHGGGIIGKESGGTRFVPAAVFANAQRAHGGLKPKERPIIALDDEGVFTKEQMKALGGRADSGSDRLLQQLLEKSGPTQVVLVDDRKSVEEFMTSHEGQKVHIKVARRNRRSINSPTR